MKPTAMRATGADRSAASTIFSALPALRIQHLDWQELADELDNFGCARLDRLLTDEECGEIATLYSEDALFRSRVVMGRHGFGKGEYKYFRYPLPEPIAQLRIGALLEACRDRQSLERRDENRRTLPSHARRIPVALPRRGPG